MNDLLRNTAMVLVGAAPLWAAPQNVLQPGQQPVQQDPGQYLAPAYQTPQEQMLQQLFQPPPDPMNSTWVRQRQAPRRQFTGFPTFPPRLAGYGAYPADPGAPGAAAPTGTAPPFPVVPSLPIDVEPEAPATSWPAWVTSKQPLPYEPGVALLAQHVQRVWWRATGEDAFIPLFFHDKFALVTSGSAIEVRQAGAFEVLLHETGRVVAYGPTRLDLERLDADTVRIEVVALTRLHVVATGREHVYGLPDGTHLRIPAVTLAPGDPVPGPAEVILERASEPGWLAGRATMTNLGDREVLWERASGTLTLQPGQRSTFFLSKPAAAAAPIPTASGVEMTRDGAVWQGAAQQAARVDWCGAAFELPPGTRLRLDPLQGDPFTPAPTAPIGALPRAAGAGR